MNEHFFQSTIATAVNNIKERFPGVEIDATFQSRNNDDSQHVAEPRRSTPLPDGSSTTFQTDMPTRLGSTRPSASDYLGHRERTFPVHLHVSRSEAVQFSQFFRGQSSIDHQRSRVRNRPRITYPHLWTESDELGRMIHGRYFRDYLRASAEGTIGIKSKIIQRDGTVHRMFKIRRRPLHYNNYRDDSFKEASNSLDDGLDQLTEYMATHEEEVTSETLEEASTRLKGAIDDVISRVRPSYPEIEITHCHETRNLDADSHFYIPLFSSGSDASDDTADQDRHEEGHRSRIRFILASMRRPFHRRR
ncbi:hypothetical protein I302_107881 [Kwoniella bestiolae CBS 10118]|uniref:Uncharacterized protein n=1 Tax=Kwoniella bestiolae CBS 10118 TaxID=1296100 RepID=A0A1B9FX98_9TREE|nr:hypothetical protein I302_06377 [Kwoniella bestiolae CBS 10118]OCF23396.1 hypothetical protein I302_06377 [Kwoniella bestiolae CBS 10118]